MSKLIEIRIADADESVSRIQDALEQAMSRRDDAAKLEDYIPNLKAETYSIEPLIDYSKRILRQQESTWPELREKLGEAGRALKSLKEMMERMAEEAEKVKKSFSNDEQLTIHNNKTTFLVQTKHREIAAIRSDARQQTSTVDKLLQTIETTKPLWEEHIETVAGMVLRDESFDGGLSALIDRLIKICSGYAPFGMTSTLNVLGRDHTVVKDLHYTVYFRFPTWSVWGLPLAAHEFWHASSLGRDGFKDQLRRNAQALEVWDETLVQDCLADSFATFVIGPAYAFASVALLLNVNSLQDRVRANMVFATLEYLADGNEESYAFVPELQTCWNEAAGVMGAQQSRDGECLLGRECRLVDKLMKYQWDHNRDPKLKPEWVSCPLERANQTDRLTECCPMLSTALIDQMRIALLQYMPPELRYGTDVWRAAGDELQEFLNANGEEEEKEDSLPRGVDLRHVLHAAWLNRWEAPEQDAVYISEVAKRVERLCERVPMTEPQRTFHSDPNGPR
jgi:hypothetical protein